MATNGLFCAFVGVANFALVALAEGDDAEHVLHVELAGDEVVGQGGMDFGQHAVAQLADFIDRLAEAAAHHAGPDAIDKRLGKPGILRADDPLGQFGPPRARR